MMKYLNKPAFNLLDRLLFTIIGSAFMMTSNFTEKGAGMASIVIMWIPAVIGIGTMVFYNLSRLLFKKFN